MNSYIWQGIGFSNLLYKLSLFWTKFAIDILFWLPFLFRSKLQYSYRINMIFQSKTFLSSNVKKRKVWDRWKRLIFHYKHISFCTVYIPINHLTILLSVCLSWDLTEGNMKIKRSGGGRKGTNYKVEHGTATSYF